MYLSHDAVQWAVQQLQERSHPFVGISFLACKKARLPVGQATDISVDAITKTHLEDHHRLDPNSVFYFQPFKSNRLWVVRKYPSSGLQAMNTQTFGAAFLHQKARRRWGFRHDYVATIRDVVAASHGYGAIPLSALAIWIGKNTGWQPSATLSTVVDKLIADYDLTRDETTALFLTKRRPPAPTQLFSPDPPDLRALAHAFGSPPDAPGQATGTLASLHLRDVGPAQRFDLHFGDRLTLVAGDNGLGKSFLLDVTWRALTGTWAGRQATPIVDRKKRNPSIQSRIRYTGKTTRTLSSHFERQSHTWRDDRKQDTPSITALCIYARVDGSIAVSDETRGRLHARNQASLDLFSSSEVWNSKTGEIEGLVRDWATWQMSHAEGDGDDPFSTFVQILEHLSSEDLGPLAPGSPVRIPGDPRTIPTIRFAYGDVPIVMASAGVQRILSLAYIVTWAWHEHKIAAREVDETPAQKMVVLVDEVEAHLHPRWQRVILPALMTLGKLLSEDLNVQIIAATHSPLILASVETDFSADSDVLYHLQLADNSVRLDAVEYQKYGDSSGWLTSPVFGLRHARSREAENAIERAKRVQLSSDPDPVEVRLISKELQRSLAPDDAFWPRWVYFAEQIAGGNA